MEYAEEQHARDFYARLEPALSTTVPDATVSVSGDGVHWTCRALRAPRQCSVSFFHVFEKAEYLTRFEEPQGGVWGRTFDRELTIDAVSAWLQNASVADLYDRFAFVEETRRTLEKIEREVLILKPVLSDLTQRQLASEFPDLSDGCALWFSAGDRACRIAFYGYNDAPGAEFFWDSCLQMKIQTADAAQLAGLLKRWLCDRAMPSAIGREFPSVDVQSVAAFYEQGRPLEGEFLQSWDQVERFYSGQDAFMPVVRSLVAELRAAGYDRMLRAGTSLFDLLLSRSRRHGLRPDQPYIALSFGGAPFMGGKVAPGTMKVTVRLDAEQRIVLPKIALNEQLDSLLKLLAAEPVD